LNKLQGSQADKYNVWALVEPRVSDVQIKDAFCSCPVGDGGSFPSSTVRFVSSRLMRWRFVQDDAST
jgi:hypothetical protein